MVSGPTITFGFPEQDVLASLGRLTIMSGHLDYILKMTFKSLKGISIVEALQHTNKQNGRILRQRIIELAKEKLVEEEALAELMGLIDRAWKAAEIRNRFIHNLWGRKEYSELLLQNDDLSWSKAPTKEDVDDLTNEISNTLSRP